LRRSPTELDGTVRAIRPRRLRSRVGLRDWVAETDLGPARTILPLFVRATDGPPEPIPSLPGVARHAPDDAAARAEEAFRWGIRSVLLFGTARGKSPDGREASEPDAAVPRALRAIKARVPDLVAVADVCLCGYTDHGHCGVLRGESVDNDSTLRRLGRVAVTYAEAGADLVAPSAMMDHQVAHLREALDSAGHTETGILAYAAKFASSFYGPFRDAADSAPSFGDRRSYQLDIRNAREAEREVDLDVREGADLVMVKPALPCLDILARVRPRVPVPLVAYQVSGEYAQIKAAAERGWVDERAAVEETLTSIRRAGADLIVTYFALDLARQRRGDGTVA
jgi:porphobilinogen synthase